MISLSETVYTYILIIWYIGTYAYFKVQLGKVK